ncbi:MAG: hypothetical protein IJN45_03270 [Alistipes sp.]|nr:hypothetical protein [Alistipes sp.]MBQ6988150.1 hypothetical protein [Alistipes sp.]
MNDNLKNAIQNWQEENKENRAIIVIALEKISSDEEKTSANIAAAIIGKHTDLVEAVSGCLKDKNHPARGIIREAEVKIAIDNILK